MISEESTGFVKISQKRLKMQDNYASTNNRELFTISYINKTSIHADSFSYSFMLKHFMYLSLAILLYIVIEQKEVHV